MLEPDGVLQQPVQIISVASASRCGYIFRIDAKHQPNRSLETRPSRLLEYKSRGAHSHFPG
jgi:hypothetical protein